MKQEEKELLLKDISARLPYGVKLLHTPTNEITNLEMIGNGVIDGNIHDLIENFKPYLFPLESMTEEQCDEFINTCTFLRGSKFGWTDRTFDWLNKNHFDYRGLIPKGLANDATGLNIY